MLRVDLGAPLQGKDDMKYQAAQRSIPEVNHDTTRSQPSNALTV